MTASRTIDVRQLYYITQRDNVPSIHEKGILCHSAILTQNVKYTPIYDEQIVSNRQSRTCPDGKYREESKMSNEQVAPETKGVTVKLLATVDLGPEIEGMAGRQLRMRMVTIEPGGVFGPLHDHKDRPGTVYILQGTITDHRNGVATDYGPGVGWPEDRNTTHWLENRGTTPAVEISVDIVRVG